MPILVFRHALWCTVALFALFCVQKISLGYGILHAYRGWMVKHSVRRWARGDFLIRLNLTATSTTLCVQFASPLGRVPSQCKTLWRRRRRTIVFSLHHVTPAWCPFTWRHVAASSWFSCVLKQHLSQQPAVPLRVISGMGYVSIACIIACVDAYWFTPENTPSTSVVKFKEFNSKVGVTQNSYRNSLRNTTDSLLSQLWPFASIFVHET